MAPERIEPKFVERVWGNKDLSPLYPPQTNKIGEVWFENGRLLIKFLFTTDNLSVQVHPDDAYARRYHDSNGKTEMWHILRAEPGAKLALGFKERYEAGLVRRAAETGDIMDMLSWVPAHAGDTFFVPAGAVHAIGGGLTLCEIQQTSDVTYRMYDYGRPRELHLDRSMDVARLEPYHPQKPNGAVLARCPYFVTERFEWSKPFRYEPAGGGDEALIILQGRGQFSDARFEAGQVWRTPSAFDVTPEASTVVLRTYVPG